MGNLISDNPSFRVKAVPLRGVVIVNLFRSGDFHITRFHKAQHRLGHRPPILTGGHWWWVTNINPISHKSPPLRIVARQPRLSYCSGAQTAKCQFGNPGCATVLVISGVARYTAPQPRLSSSFVVCNASRFLQATQEAVSW